MWDEILAANSAMFSMCAMSSASLRSFGGAPVLQGKTIRRSISDGFLDCPECSAAIDIFCVLPFLKIGAAVTVMVFSFRITFVHCCTGSLLALVAVMVTILVGAGACMCVEARVGVRVGRVARAVCWDCSALLLAAYCLGGCLSAAPAATARSEISGSGVAIAGGSMWMWS